MTKVNLFNQELQEMAFMFKAFSHPARLAILKHLAESKVCISGDISHELPLGRSTVHQHLGELKKLGIIKGEIKGSKTNYCLNTDRACEIRQRIDDFMYSISYSGVAKC